MKKNIIIFGGSGCLGKNLIKHYINKDDYNIINYSRDEHKHWKLDNIFGKNIIKHVIGDANDNILVKKILTMYNPYYIFIIHALKHVDRCQENIHSCITTNLLSVKNVLDCIQENVNYLTNLNTVIFTSTDKAPSPINAYGMCKALCEELIIEKSKELDKIKFVTVRYGNVINSTSSLLPLLLQNNTDTYYITDYRMTRFFMTIQNAIDTILYAIEYADSGDIIIPIVKSFYIKDMINYVANLKNKTVQKIGLRPGERLYETLINDTQSIRCIKKFNYYHIKPYYKKYNNYSEPFIYDSNTNIITDSLELENLLEDIITLK